ncbi:MAG: MerR family transcriptional regulator [Woeseiaceae bacterium]|nr:MerR family transcriptional regulator [Woeseiaceae bacterium]
MTDQTTFAIGAVSRLLGLSQHALRKWEVRYGAVTPERSEGGDRRYTEDDLGRLSRLKQLVDLGHPISSVAKLDDAELEDLLDRHSGTSAAPELKLAVVGPRLERDLIDASKRLPRVEIVATFDGIDSVDRTDADVVAVELPYLNEDSHDELRRLRERAGVSSLVIVYRYGASEIAERLTDANTALFKPPLNMKEVGRTLSVLSAERRELHPTLGLPQHRFSRKLLSDIALLSPALACECPRHVAQIIMELSDFEAYSADCEQTKPADAQIHHLLRRTAATARSLFEEALIELAAAEDISLAEEQA